MTVLRSDIEKALNELKSFEDGTRFQTIVTSLANYKWPHLTASEWHNDLGADMHAIPLLSPEGKGIVLASSITDDLPGKIKSDAKRAKENFANTEVLIFVTSQKVTKQTEAKWNAEIKKDFGYELVVVPREEIITFLGRQESTSLCRMIGISINVEPDKFELAKKVKGYALKLAADRLGLLKGKPLLTLKMSGLDDAKSAILELANLKGMLIQGRRIILEAPAGRGKTTTLLQLANQFGVNDGIPFFIDLPAWIRSGEPILQYLSQSPYFHGISPDKFAKIREVENFSFLVNGWNELSDAYSEQALIALQQLAYDFPGAGIIVATRAHYLNPPLTHASRLTLLALNKAQRLEYLKNALGSRAEALRSKLDGDLTLDALTRTPLILSAVVEIFKSGDLDSIPRTKIGVLDKVTNLMETSSESKEQLKRPPLSNNARDYLSCLATKMTEQMEGSVSL